MTESTKQPQYSPQQAGAALRRAVERERNTLRITEGQRRALRQRPETAVKAR